MSELEEITKLINEHDCHNCGKRDDSDSCAYISGKCNEELAVKVLMKKLQIRVKCPEYKKTSGCIFNGNGKRCTDDNMPPCKGTGEITKFPESGDRGEIL